MWMLKDFFISLVKKKSGAQKKKKKEEEKIFIGYSQRAHIKHLSLTIHLLYIVKKEKKIILLWIIAEDKDICLLVNWIGVVNACLLIMLILIGLLTNFWVRRCILSVIGSICVFSYKSLFGGTSFCYLDIIKGISSARLE